MREAADQLDINYSTAKTIVQTFRKEKRVAKKPKRLITTKKSIEKERSLVQFLSQFKVKSLMSSVIKTELALKKKSQDVAISEAPTLGSITRTNTLQSNLHKALPRVESAGDMLLFGLDEDGPYAGQMSRGISVNMDQAVQKRPIFFVMIETDVEEEYKKSLDYSNLVLLRNKQPIISQEQIVIKPQEKPESSLTNFDFRDYGKRILANDKGTKLECDLNERMLPIPKLMNHVKI